METEQQPSGFSLGRGGLIAIGVLGVALVCSMVIMAWQSGRISGLENAQVEVESKSSEATKASTEDEAELLMDQPKVRRSITDITRSEPSIEPAPEVEPEPSDDRRIMRSTKDKPSVSDLEIEYSARDDSSDEAEAVRQYFDDLDRAASSVPSGVDPEAMAGQLLEQIMTGDFSGLDDLAATQQLVIDNIKQVHTPRPCKEHHRRTVATMEGGRDMLSDMRTALETEDMTKIMFMAMQAQTLMSDAEEVDRLGEELKQKYGIR